MRLRNVLCNFAVELKICTKMKSFISRDITPAIKEAYIYFPVIVITGPRQSGKTTLIKEIFNELPYYSLENLDTQRFAKEDPVGFLRSSMQGMILDEVQNAPELLSYIQEIVDNNSNIRFILSGSSNFTMIQSVSQSLAGRSAIFELLPLSINELPNETIGTTSLSELLYKGLYPSIWSNGTPPTIMYRNYVKTYLERDVRNISAIKDLSLFQKFLRLCANRIGSIFVASQLANELGVSVNTILSWLSILEASYVVIMLSPFHENTRKRLTKSPKLYFTDTGLAAYLLDIETITQLNNDKMRGHLFENLIVTEALKYRFNKGKDSNLYFYRDSHMNEVDLILKNADKLKLIEIKSSETYHQEFEKGIKAFCKEFGDKVEDNTIIYAGDLENTTREIKLLNYSRLYEIL